MKLEWENGEFERARALLSRARERASTARIWMKSALLEWEVGEFDAERKMLEEGLRRYPEFDKMWMMLGQMEVRARARGQGGRRPCPSSADGLCGAQEERGGDVAARDAYRQGLRNCPTSVPLWQLAARLELRTNGVVKARTLLELARLKNPKSDQLWLEAVRVEQEHGDGKLAASLMAKALQVGGTGPRPAGPAAAASLTGGIAAGLPGERGAARPGHLHGPAPGAEAAQRGRTQAVRKRRPRGMWRRSGASPLDMQPVASLGGRGRRRSPFPCAGGERGPAVLARSQTGQDAQVAHPRGQAAAGLRRRVGISLQV